MRSRRRMLVVALAMGMVAGSGVGPAAAQEPSTAPSQGSAPWFGASLGTPDDAVRAYLAGVAAADVGRILDAVAVDEMAIGFDFVAYVERLRAFAPAFNPSPATEPLFVDLNRVQVTSQVLGQVRMLIYSLLTDLRLDGTTIVPADAGWATDLVAQLDLARLADLTILDSRFPDPDLETDERYRTNAARQAAVYGADELTERLVLVRVEGRTYAVGFTLLRYGDVWRVSSQTSALAGLPAFGTAQPLSVEEYEAATSGE